MIIAPPEPQAESEHLHSTAGLPRFRAFHALYAYLVEKNTDLLGLRGFRFQLRIEEASTLEELQAIVAPLSEAIEKKHGLIAAKNFKREGERRIRGALAKGPD
jgi:hypothetical protein